MESRQFGACLQKLPIPVNIITGHLACGKTTVICSLLRRKPPDEHWAVLVNEFGALGIDAALIESSSESGYGAQLYEPTGLEQHTELSIT